MGYADLKNDVVFRKVFGQHPRVLAALLNDLLERSGDSTIVEIEYLPGEQFPPLLGMKLSILDVRCREKGGATFLVEVPVGTALSGRPPDRSRRADFPHRAPTSGQRAAKRTEGHGW